MTSYPYHPVDHPPLPLSSVLSQMSRTHAIASTSELVMEMKSDQASQDSNIEQTKDDEQVGVNQVRSYGCTFCKRGFSNAQALGGHMNIHRKDKAKLMRQSTADYEISTHHSCPDIPKQLPLFAEFPSGRILKPDDVLVHVKADDKGFSVDRSFLLEQSYLDLELRLGGPANPHAPAGRPATKKFF